MACDFADRRSRGANVKAARMSFSAPISQLSFNDYVKLVSCMGVPALLAFLYVHRRSSARTWPLGRLAQIVRGAVVDLMQVGVPMRLLEAGYRSAPTTSVAAVTGDP
jgi:hypothetical protein